MTKKVLLIGGGTGGHIFPLRNLADEFKKQNIDVELVVADQKLDKKIVQENFSDINTHFFQTGKIRRYFSLHNFVDIFRIVAACWKARRWLRKINPDIIFFKGGFVGFPFLVAAKLLMRFPGKIIAHESDISAGMLTKLAKRWADLSFSNFGEHPLPLFYSPQIEHQKPKVENFPTPLSTKGATRQSQSRKKILVFGGSQGAQFLNDVLRENLPSLLQTYEITLIAGHKKQIDFHHRYFHQKEFVSANDIAQLILVSDLIIARGGANSLFEIIAAQRPSIIIPLPSVARNHQYHNAKYFSDRNLCHILEQNSQTKSLLPKAIQEAFHDETMQKKLKEKNIHNASKEIVQNILQIR